MRQKIQRHTSSYFALAACLLACGLMACQPEKQEGKADDSGLFKTESIAWEEKQSAEYRRNFSHFSDGFPVYLYYIPCV